VLMGAAGGLKYRSGCFCYEELLVLVAAAVVAFATWNMCDLLQAAMIPTVFITCFVLQVAERLQLKRNVPAAMDRAILEILTPVVERCVCAHFSICDGHVRIHSSNG
jgi:hypothetical protein